MARIASVVWLVASAGCAQIVGGRDVTLVNAGPAPVQRSDPESLTISATIDDGDAKALASALPGTSARTVDVLLGKANRPMTPLCHTGAQEALAPLTALTASYGFCWATKEAGAADDIDPDSSSWVPQGITTSRDADGPRPYDGREVVVVVWHTSTDTSVRMSIAPAHGFGDPASPNYRHVLLVDPEPGADFAEVACHAGGAVWYGHLLYVACGQTIKIFDWNDVYNVDAPHACDDVVGKIVDPTAGTLYCASGYGYVMMQVGEITNPGGNLQFSSISLDQSSTPHRLVVSEYALEAGGKLARFDLDATTRLPTGAAAADAYDLPFPQVQGATSRGDEFWFHTSGGVVENGAPVASAYGKLRFWNAGLDYTVGHDSAYGPEALSFWPGEPGMPDSDMLYTLTEHAGQRAVIAVRRVDFE